jgi:hypothetical protein
MAPGFHAGSRLLISPTFRACHVIDVYRRETALVVTCVPERQPLAPLRRTERVVDVEDLNPGPDFTVA